ncbi:uncharacterized protein [Drosophila virilis]|uniref:Uncharacterized protein n=1 Tax=Drosophila virilis TaxID=7244 RepID=B4LFR9_DROVI|nr:uncharacterized protein LOC6622297 [Drosophila virilis]EDW69296.1 uncharacterized protein Dvir_GJ12200 [Drosophila virilis]
MSKAARMEQEIQLLRQELALMRSDRDELYQKHAKHFQLCDGGGECGEETKIDIKKLDKKGQTNQELYIAYLEEQIQRTRLKYKKQMGEVKSSATQLETQLQSVRQDMNCISAKAQLVDRLQKNIKELKSRLKRRDMIIARYNEQHAEFLGLIENLDQKSTPEQKVPKPFINIQKSDAFEDVGCDGEEEHSDIRSRCKPGKNPNFSCLGTALRKKLNRN